jgi:cysteine-rich repeat protein
MNLCKGVLATQLLVALALAGCGSDLKKDESGEKGNVGRIAARLTLPDGTSISSVHYQITGPFATMGDVPVQDSTILTFRVGGLPVDPAAYHIALTATTTSTPAQSCSGGADFNIANNDVTMVNLVLTCGEAVDEEGDVVVNGTVNSVCPIVTAITALPGEVTVTHSVSLTAKTSSPVAVAWTGAGGTFGTPNALATTFTCVDAGTHTLTVAVDSDGCDDSYTVDIICTGLGVCGNGTEEAGEQCDLGAANSDTGACTTGCHDAICGDTFVQAGVEQCDDGGNVNGDGCSSTCQIEPPPAAVCGNGGAPEAGEDCDDGNTVTEACDYGDTDGCTVCDSTCHNVAGATAFCGDSIPNGGEQCDDGPTGSATCTASCTSVAGPSACETCRAANCTNYQGFINAVAGCFDAGSAGQDARAVFGPTAGAFTAAQVQLCVDAMACAEANNCGHTAGSIANDCYCGAFHTTPTVFGLDECAASGPDGTPPCRDEWEAMTGQTAPGLVLASISDAENTIAGWAYFLLECDATQCNEECVQ